MARFVALSFIVLAAGAFVACSTKAPAGAPDLACNPIHTCPSNEHFDESTCSCAPYPDMTANQPMDLGDTD